MEEENVLKYWNHKCDNVSDAVKLSVQLESFVGGEMSVTIHFVTR